MMNNVAHTYHQNLGHLIFHTRGCIIREDDLARLHGYLAGVAERIGIKHPIVGGTGNHIHLLGNFPVSYAVADLVAKIKASSSHWMKGVHSRYRAFTWQQGYAYYSVSYSMYNTVERYIAGQKQHHAHMSAEEEFRLLLEKHALLQPHTPEQSDGAADGTSRVGPLP